MTDICVARQKNTCSAKAQAKIASDIILCRALWFFRYRNIDRRHKVVRQVCGDPIGLQASPANPINMQSLRADPEISDEQIGGPSQ
jgi:hypothetical protein